MTAKVTAPQALYHGIEQGQDQHRALAFLGIPYAAPPLGTLRFRPPEPLAPGGEINATAYGNAPIQDPPPVTDWSIHRAPQSYGEDCLNLNLWTPAADGKRRPVIVHLFGGGFATGSANVGHFNGAAFASANDVVLVRPNVRTGALGFLHLAEHFPGLDQSNRSMLDLAAALRWVRANIEAFGGDPQNVTLAGMSSGGFTAAALFGTADGPTLFDKCWLLSGYATRIQSPERAAEIAADFLTRAGVAPGDEAGLAALSAEDILRHQAEVVAVNLAERSMPGGKTLGIVQDGTTLPRHPEQALRDGALKDCPLVLGRTRHEARLWYATGRMGTVDEARFRQTIARFDGDSAVETELARWNAAMPGADWQAKEEDFLTDRIYRRATAANAAAQRAGGGRAWVYEFAWAPKPPHDWLGATHGSDESFVYGLHDIDKVPVALTDPVGARAVAAETEAALIQFMRDGDPGWGADLRVFGD
ncbi:carboxylesterase family protein [Pseudooceanicola sp.]|uniref:carboxylesterase family protein n=1 Tax=Pseudooceanicola sp. TaxID=1914328 RepID=UPI002605262B|nr:carboxylesterase family protein [Pseudooceanicola sp.]MDF1855247.1 carboxylesterase family protein [Pseudooceanicola sp.]